MTYRTTTYLAVESVLHDALAPALAAGLGRTPGLESEVTTGKDCLEVTLKIEAADKPTAERKALYWIERGSKAMKIKGLRWRGRVTKKAKVVKWTT